MPDSTIVYLAVLEDRKVDTVITVHTSLIKALKRVTEWQVEYDARYSEPYEWHFHEDCWEYYLTTTDDGPSLRIEKKGLL